MSMDSLDGHVEAVRDGNPSQDILMTVLHPGKTACYDRLTGVNFTSAPTLFTFGFKSGASESLVQSFATPAAGVVVSTTGRIFVDSGDTPFLRVTGGVAGDRIALYVFGYLSDKSY